MKAMIRIEGRRARIISQLMQIFIGKEKMNIEMIKTSMLDSPVQVTSTALKGILSMYPFFKNVGEASKTSFNNKGNYPLVLWEIDLIPLIKKYEITPSEYKTGSANQFLINTVDNTFTRITKKNFDKCVLELHWEE
tara:strand:+ start:866 stop:1273 length:408 start_codon:yes stop_codon:yes gene_type:complete